MEKLLWIIFGAFIFVILSILFWWWQRPSIGKITKRSARQEKVVMAEQKYQSENFSFAYEDKYELRENGNSLELVGNAGVSSHIVVTIKDNISTNLEDVSGVLMRRLKPEKYTEEKIIWGNIEGVLFKHIVNFELSAFFLKDGKSVTVSMTANSNDETGLGEEFEKLVESMVLK